MDQQETKLQVAQPADEEIKKHGDQLAKQVRDAAGKSSEEESPATSEQQANKE